MKVTAIYPPPEKPKISGYTIELSSDETFQLVRLFGQISRNDIRSIIKGISDDSVEKMWQVTSQFYRNVLESGQKND